MNYQQLSPYRYTIDEIIEVASDPTIIHNYGKEERPEYGESNKRITNLWIEIVNKTGFIEEMKVKFPIPFLEIKNKNEN